MIYKFSSKVWLGDGNTTFLRGDGEITAYKSPISLTNDTNTLFFHIENEGGLTTYKVEAFNFQNVVDGMTINDCTHISFGDGIKMCTSRYKCIEARPTVGKFTFEYSGGGFVYNDDTMGNGNPNPDEPTDDIVVYCNALSPIDWSSVEGVTSYGYADKKFFDLNGTYIQDMMKIVATSMEVFEYGKSFEWFIYADNTQEIKSISGEVYAKYVVIPPSVHIFQENSLSFALGSNGFLRLPLTHNTDFQGATGLKDGGNIIITTDAPFLNFSRDWKLYDEVTFTNANVFISENILTDILNDGINVSHTFADSIFTNNYEIPIIYLNEEYRNFSTHPFKAEIDGERVDVGFYIQNANVDDGTKNVEVLGWYVDGSEKIVALEDYLSDTLVGINAQKISSLAVGNNPNIYLSYEDVTNLYEIYRLDTQWYVDSELVSTYQERYSDTTFKDIAEFGGE